MNALIQRFLQIVALVMLTVSHGIIVNFCTCTGELFGDECPCAESHCEHDACQESPYCYAVIEFDSEDYVYSASNFNLSDDSVGSLIPQPSPTVSFSDSGTASLVQSVAHTGLLPGESRRENCVFAEFVNVRI